MLNSVLHKNQNTNLFTFAFPCQFRRLQVCLTWEGERSVLYLSYKAMSHTQAILKYMILGKANKECSWKAPQKFRKNNQHLGFQERVVKKPRQPNNSQIILLSSSNPLKSCPIPPTFIGYLTSTQKNKKQAIYEFQYKRCLVSNL